MHFTEGRLREYERMMQEKSVHDRRPIKTMKERECKTVCTLISVTKNAAGKSAPYMMIKRQINILHQGGSMTFYGKHRLRCFPSFPSPHPSP